MKSENLKLDLALYLSVMVISISGNQGIAIITFLFAIYTRLGVILEVIANKK